MNVSISQNYNFVKIMGNLCGCGKGNDLIVAEELN